MEGPPREIFQPRGKRLPKKPAVAPIVERPAAESEGEDESSSEDEEIKKKLLQ
jgi:hypothetical protein